LARALFGGDVEEERPVKKILVLCPNSWDKEALASERIREGREIIYDYEHLLDTPAEGLGTFDTFDFMRAIAGDYRDRGLAGVVGTGDYPGAILAAHVGKDLGLTVPDPKVVTLLSHKWHSREIQRRSAPEATPEYFALDPFEPLPENLPLPFPFFVKPVKGTMSVRARMVRDTKDLEAAVRTSPAELANYRAIFAPFQQLLDAYGDVNVPALHFIAESPLSGDQVTVDGFVQNGRAEIMGIVESIMYPGTYSFKRFEYPASFPKPVLERMAGIAKKVLEASGFDHACFNIELFYDRANDRIAIIEINPRMSYQFGDLYERVDGMNTYEVQLRLALGEPVRWSRGSGKDGAAASFVMRRFTDALCTRVPSEAEIEAVKSRFPGTTIKVLAKVGERLSEQDQDVGSYRYAIINMGAPDQTRLHGDYSVVERMLSFEFS
jgi:hypothetical protein